MSDHALQPRHESPSLRIYRTVAAFFMCSLFSTIYGALAGAAYALLLVRAIDGNAAVLGAIFGAIYGSLTGAIGAALGGPGGWCVGGVLGCLIPGMLHFPPGSEFLGVVQGAIIPALIAAAFGATVGFAARLGIPVLPGMTGLIRAVYGSPLGNWLGWRR